MSNAQLLPEPPQKKLNGEWWKGFFDLLGKAISETPAPLRLLIVIPACGAVLAALLTPAFIWAGHSDYGIWLASAAILLFIVALPFFLYAVVKYVVAHQPQPGPVGGAVLKVVKPTWTRNIPKLPLPDDESRELGAALEDICTAAFRWLAQRRSDIPLRPEQIRANIFLPDYTRPDAGMAFTLYMPDGLRFGMDHHPDEKITFRPGQGLTGLVFVKQQGRIAQTIETNAGRHEFDEVYHLTAEHKKEIHPDLRWIVSFPLTIPEGDKRKATGVLNVDGLVHQFSEDDLDLLAGWLAAKVGAVADKTSLLPMVRVSITVEG